MSQIVKVGGFSSTWPLEIDGFVECIDKCQIKVLFELVAGVAELSVFFM
jgi:hypothetical protein